MPPGRRNNEGVSRDTGLLLHNVMRRSKIAEQFGAEGFHRLLRARFLPLPQAIMARDDAGRLVVPNRYHFGMD